MDKRIEEVVIAGIDLLKDKDPKLLDALVKKKYFFTVINVGGELNVYVDPSKKMSVHMTWEYFEDESMRLYGEFSRIKQWNRA